jgi:hypothetical protein
MRKTTLAILVASAVVAAPAFAQVSLGGAGRAGAGLGAGVGAGLQPMQSASQLGNRTGRDLEQTDRRLHHSARSTDQQSRAALRHHGKADADMHAQGHAGANAGGNHAQANADTHAAVGVDAGAAADRVGATSRGAGRQASDTAHSTLARGEHEAHAVGAQAQRAADQPVRVDAHAGAKAQSHGG